MTEPSFLECTEKVADKEEQHKLGESESNDATNE